MVSTGPDRKLAQSSWGRFALAEARADLALGARRADRLAETSALGLPQAAYTASKAGLIGLTRDLAAQWTGRKGIRVKWGQMKGADRPGQDDSRERFALKASRPGWSSR